jgi:hypothetical protein
MPGPVFRRTGSVFNHPAKPRKIFLCIYRKVDRGVLRIAGLNIADTEAVGMRVEIRSDVLVMTGFTHPRMGIGQSCGPDYLHAHSRGKAPGKNIGDKIVLTGPESRNSPGLRLCIVERTVAVDTKNRVQTERARAQENTASHINSVSPEYLKIVIPGKLLKRIVYRTVAGSQYQRIKACYPSGPGQNVLQERTPVYRTQTFTGKPAGIHPGKYDSAYSVTAVLSPHPAPDPVVV